MKNKYFPIKPFHVMTIKELKDHVINMKKRYPLKKLKKRKKKTRYKLRKTMKFKKMTKKNKRRYLKLSI